MNYIKAVADVTPQSGEAARQKALDEIFNPIERIFSKDDSDAGKTRRPSKRTRSFKISPMKRPGTVPVPAGTTDDGTMHENTEASKTEMSDSAKADTVTDEPTAETGSVSAETPLKTAEEPETIPAPDFAFSPSFSAEKDQTENIPDFPADGTFELADEPEKITSDIPDHSADIFFSPNAGLEITYETDAEADPGPKFEDTFDVITDNVFSIPADISFTHENIVAGEPDDINNAEDISFDIPSGVTETIPDESEEKKAEQNAEYPEIADILFDVPDDTSVTSADIPTIGGIADIGISEDAESDKGQPETSEHRNLFRRLFKSKKEDSDPDEDFDKDPEAIKDLTVPGITSLRLIPEDIKIIPREGGRGAVEKELEELKEQHADAEVSRPLGPGGVTVLILLIAALLLSIGFGIYRVRTAPLKKEQLLMQQLEGTWKSNVFALKENENQSLEEQMVINADGTFTEKLYYVDPDGEVKQDVRTIEGTLEIFIDENIIISFCYPDSGGEYYYIRELLSVTSEGMTLREYYDESHKESYDLIFTRVQNEQK